jgi:hypothetical protein
MDKGCGPWAVCDTNCRFMHNLNEHYSTSAPYSASSLCLATCIGRPNKRSLGALKQKNAVLNIGEFQRNCEYCHISPNRLMQIFTGLSPYMTGFDHRYVMLNLWWERWYLDKLYCRIFLSVLLKDKDPKWANLVTRV